MFKKRLELKPVGGFTTASDEGNIWQNGFLLKTPQNHIRTKPFRKIRQFFFQVFRRKMIWSVQHNKTPVFPFQSLAYIIPEVEKIYFLGFACAVNCFESC